MINKHYSSSVFLPDAGGPSLRKMGSLRPGRNYDLENPLTPYSVSGRKSSQVSFTQAQTRKKKSPSLKGKLNGSQSTSKISATTSKLSRKSMLVVSVPSKKPRRKKSNKSSRSNSKLREPCEQKQQYYLPARKVAHPFLEDEISPISIKEGSTMAQQERYPPLPNEKKPYHSREQEAFAKQKRDELIAMLEKEVAELHTKELNQPSSVELLKLEINEVQHKIKDARLEAKLSKDESERMLMQQEKEIRARQEELENYMRTCAKSLEINHQLTAKFAKYKQLHSAIAQSIQDAGKGIGKLFAENKAIEAGLETNSKEIQNERKRGIEIDARTAISSQNLQSLDKDLATSLKTIKKLKHDYDQRQFALDDLELDNGRKSNEYRLVIEKLRPMEDERLKLINKKASQKEEFGTLSESRKKSEITKEELKKKLAEEKTEQTVLKAQVKLLEEKEKKLDHKIMLLQQDQADIMNSERDINLEKARLEKDFEKAEARKQEQRDISKQIQTELDNMIGLGDNLSKALQSRNNECSKHLRARKQQREIDNRLQKQIIGHEAKSRGPLYGAGFSQEAEEQKQHARSGSLMAFEMQMGSRPDFSKTLVPPSLGTIGTESTPTLPPHDRMLYRSGDDVENRLGVSSSEVVHGPRKVGPPPLDLSGEFEYRPLQPPPSRPQRFIRESSLKHQSTEIPPHVISKPPPSSYRPEDQLSAERSRPLRSSSLSSNRRQLKLKASSSPLSRRKLKKNSDHSRSPDSQTRPFASRQDDYRSRPLQQRDYYPASRSYKHLTSARYSKQQIPEVQQPRSSWSRSPANQGRDYQQEYNQSLDRLSPSLDRRRRNREPQSFSSKHQPCSIPRQEKYFNCGFTEKFYLSKEGTYPSIRQSSRCDEKCSRQERSLYDEELRIGNDLSLPEKYERNSPEGQSKSPSASGLRCLDPAFLDKQYRQSRLAYVDETQEGQSVTPRNGCPPARDPRLSRKRRIQEGTLAPAQSNGQKLSGSRSKTFSFGQI